MFTSYKVAPKIADGTGITVSLKKQRSAPATMSFTLKPSVVGELGWKAGAKIEIALGEEEHHGLVRLKPTDDGTAELKLRQAGGAEAGGRGGPYYSIGLGAVSLFVNRSEEKRWVTWDRVEDGWVEIVLPKWADETGPKAVQARNRPIVPGAPLALPAPRPAAVARTASLMGDPPAARSALAGRQPEPTKGDARRAAEAREAPLHAKAEAVDRRREEEELERTVTLRRLFGLTPTEGVYLDALMDGRVRTKEMLFALGHEETDTEGGIKIVDVYVHKLRKKIRTRGIDIETVRAVGFQMTEASIAVITGLLAEKKAAA